MSPLRRILLLDASRLSALTGIMVLVCAFAAAPVPPWFLSSLCTKKPLVMGYTGSMSLFRHGDRVDEWPRDASDPAVAHLAYSGQTVRYGPQTPLQGGEFGRIDLMTTTSVVLGQVTVFDPKDSDAVAETLRASRLVFHGLGEFRVRGGRIIDSPLIHTRGTVFDAVLWIGGWLLLAIAAGAVCIVYSLRPRVVAALSLDRRGRCWSCAYPRNAPDTQRPDCPECGAAALRADPRLVLTTRE